MDKNYIDKTLANWKTYNIADSKQEFCEILNILDAHNETIENLLEAPFRGDTIFCEIVGRFKNARDVVKALFDYNKFCTADDVANLIFAEIEELKENDLFTDAEIDEHIKKLYCDDYYGDDLIIRTFSGYVHYFGY